MHNNIMAAGSRDRPPMLATRRYAQWQSRFMRYVNIKPNGEALRKFIQQGPYKLSNIIIPGQPATDESLAIPEQTIPETFLNITPKNKAHYNAKKEAIHLLLTGIGDEIYSTIDACKTAHEMWIAIERLQQGESLNKQDVKTKWSRFMTIVKQTQDLDTVSHHKLFDILKYYQKEVNEIRAEKIAKIANSLALVVATQQYPNTYYPAPKSHKSYAPPSKQSSSTISHATTKHKGKEIAKPVTPPSEVASKEDNDPEQAQRDKDMQKNLALIAKYFKNIYKPTNNNLRTSSNSKNKNVGTTLRYVNENQTAHYSFMAKIQEVLPADSGSDAEPFEKIAIDYAVSERLRKLRLEEAWKTIKDLAQHEEEEEKEEWNDPIFFEKGSLDCIDATLEHELESMECQVESLMRSEVLLDYENPHKHLNSNLKMPILRSFEENKLEFEDEVEIKMMGTGMDKELPKHNLHKNDITLIICCNFSLTSNLPIKPKDSGSFRIKGFLKKRKKIFTDPGDSVRINPDGVASIWMEFGGNTRDLGSFGEEADKTMTLQQIL
uniref:Integrase, catalytic region, zinc finger, CCHC-type, peptidase aspartic, catalytic n=1 Tax=Tanacetum cinerariifolium TaxID=118510 RepID=A0A6L2JIZ4_TANCI|nr:integrase, catalytic region, zinc finger, CCHC-type, peptidase aspartic, catalytic [Tanacetum cinerariifolium]